MPAPRRRISRLLPALGAVVVVASMAGCTRPVTNIDEPEAKDLFVNACTTDVQLNNGERTETELASRDYCECVWNDIRTIHKISNDDYKAYQDRIAKGEDLANPPEEIKAAIDSCSAGPVGPRRDAPTTTAAEG